MTCREMKKPQRSPFWARRSVCGSQWESPCSQPIAALSATSTVSLSQCVSEFLSGRLIRNGGKSKFFTWAPARESCHGRVCVCVCVGLWGSQLCCRRRQWMRRRRRRNRRRSRREVLRSVPVTRPSSVWFPRPTLFPTHTLFPRCTFPYYFSLPPFLPPSLPSSFPLFSLVKTLFLYFPPVTPLVP